MASEKTTTPTPTTAPNPTQSAFAFLLELPPRYTPSDAIKFHGRDKEGVSESVSDTEIRKAVLLCDVPTLLTYKFGPDTHVAQCLVLADGKITETMQKAAQDVTRGLLGLRLDPIHFAEFVADDPVFGPLAEQQGDLRIVQSASIFEALTWAVMGQQINVSFAVSLRRTFIQLAGRLHSSGMRCYPNAEDAARLSIEELTSRQYSRSKAETLLRLSKLLADGKLDLVESPENPIEAICEALLAVKGIGPWTVNYALLRGFGHADCSLHGDVAVRAAIAALWGHEIRPGIAATEIFLKQYSPHRTMAAAHLWASLSKKNAF